MHGDTMTLSHCHVSRLDALAVRKQHGGLSDAERAEFDRLRAERIRGLTELCLTGAADFDERAELLDLALGERHVEHAVDRFLNDMTGVK